MLELKEKEKKKSTCFPKAKKKSEKTTVKSANEKKNLPLFKLRLPNTIFLIANN